MNKILVVNMNYLGDALMTTPVHAALRQSFPNSAIHAIAGSQPGYGAYDILAMNPDIDLLIARVRGGFLQRSWQLWCTLTKGHYDCVIILPPIRLYSIVAALALTSRRYASKRVAVPEHMSDMMLDVVRPLVEPGSIRRQMVLSLTDSDRDDCARLLEPIGARRPLIAFNLGASRPQKRWPTSSFVALARVQLAAGRSIALLGGGNDADRSAAAQIVAELGCDGLLDLTGKTNVRQLAAVIDAADLLVSVDTGAMHIAAAVQTPIVAIFGSTSSTVVGPYGPTPSRVLTKNLPCSPCNNHPTCGGRFMCMSDVTPQEVGRAVDELLGE